MANKVNRRKSRAIAMELLYSGAVNERDGGITDDFLEEFSSISDTTEVLDKEYIRQMVELAEAREGYFRKVLTPFLKDWDIKRISRINLAILRISVTELLYMKDIPPRVSVNEAIELAKTYSDEESAAFINGVLDKVLKGIQNNAIPEWTEEMEAADPAGPVEQSETVEPAGTIQEDHIGSLPEEGAAEPTEAEPGEGDSAAVEPSEAEPAAVEPSVTEHQGVEPGLPSEPVLENSSEEAAEESPRDRVEGFMESGVSEPAEESAKTPELSGKAEEEESKPSDVTEEA